MAAGILGIGISALNVALANIRTTQHNIANAGTQGYHRQEVSQAARAGQFSGGGYVGNGVDLAGVVRRYNVFLETEVRHYQAQLSRHEAYSTYATQTDSLLGKLGLSEPMDAFFASIQEVANDPTSLVARQQMLASGNILASRMQTLGGRLDEISSQINAEIAREVGQINQLSSQIASLNLLIGNSALDGGMAPNDLLDKRDQLISEMNQLVQVSQVNQSDGSVAIFLGNGQPLVVGSEVYALKAIADPADPSLTTLGVQAGSGVKPLAEAGLLPFGGRLAGLLAYRNDILKPAQSELGRIAVGLAEQFNAIHASGYGLLDSVQRDFFTPAQSLLRQPTPMPGTTAVVSASLSNSDQLVASAYELRFDGTNYTLIRLSDGASQTGTLAAVTTLAGSPQGFTLALSGTPVAGDRWSINLLADAATQFGVTLADPRHIAAATASGLPGDNGNALSLAGLHTAKTLSLGLASYQEVFRGLVGQVAIHASGADMRVQAYSAMTTRAQASQQAESGVNLDEEAMRLIQYQQAYQAAAKAIQISSNMMDELLSIIR